MDYVFRFSDPMTALTARRVRHGSSPTPQSASLGPSPGTKTHPSPPLFQQLSPSFFSPLTLHLPAPPRPFVPQTAPSSNLLPAGPPSLQNRYDAASGKNAAARPAGSYSLDAPAALSPQPSDPCVNPWTMTLVKRRAFQQVASDLATRRPSM